MSFWAELLSMRKERKNKYNKRECKMYDTINKDRLLDLMKSREFDEAISHRVHSRVFEILGYLSIIETNNLPEEVRINLDSIEELSKKLLAETHFIIDHYTSKEYSFV